eukprot:UN11149
MVDVESESNNIKNSVLRAYKNVLALGLELNSYSSSWNGLQRIKHKLSSFDGYSVWNDGRLDPIARIILMGVYDDDNILSKLRGMRYLVKHIWELTLEFNKHCWLPYIRTDEHCLEDKTSWYLSHKFPKPKNININMMPFIMELEFEKTKLPKYLKTYHDTLIMECLYCDKTQIGKIGFLTIQESIVEDGKTQRRPCVHVEHPGFVYVDNKGSGRGDKIWVETWS